MKSLLVAIAGFIALIYLLNPTAGLFEIIPDNMPLIGNLDEATAVAIILAALRYFGIDLTDFLRKFLKEPSDKNDPENK